MKLIAGMLVTALTIMSLHTNANNLNGTWELVSGEYINHEGKLIDYSELDLKSIKILSGNHFSFISMSKDTFWAAGAGTFRITDTQYIESPIHTSFQSPKGKDYTFQYEIKGDTWHNARWENGVRVEYETWRRLD